MSYGNILAESTWEKQRLGKITASKIGDLFSANERKSKTGEIDEKWSVGAATYLLEKASEILTGQSRQVSVYATEWGHAQEPYAIERLQLFYPDLIHYGNTDKQFFQYGEYNAGGTPDAETLAPLISFEVKSPENPVNHLKYSAMKKPADMEKDHYYQVQFNSLILSQRLGVPFENVSGMFVSWCPLILREEKQLFRLPVPPDMNFYKMIKPKLLKAQERIIELIENFSS